MLGYTFMGATAHTVTSYAGIAGELFSVFDDHGCECFDSNTIVVLRGCICVYCSFVESYLNVDSDRRRLGRHRLGKQADVVEDCQEGMTILM